MSWYISDLPKIDTGKYSNIVEFRNSRIDWGEFEGEKKFLLAIAEVLGERWESAKPFLEENKLDSFDQVGFVFLWFKRYMPEVLDLNPWVYEDLISTIKMRDAHEYHSITSWMDFLHFKIAFSNPDAIITAFINAGHDSSLARLLVQKTLYWCYDYSPGNEPLLIRALNEAVHKGYTIGLAFELLILLCGNPRYLSLIQHIASYDWAKEEIKFDVELKEFLEGKRKKLKRENPILPVINHVMSRVFEIFLDATSKYFTYDVNQGVLFDRAGLLSTVKQRLEVDVMNKNYYMLERSVSGDVILTGESR